MRLYWYQLVKNHPEIPRDLPEAESVGKETRLSENKEEKESAPHVIESRESDRVIFSSSPGEKET